MEVGIRTSQRSKARFHPSECRSQTTKPEGPSEVARGVWGFWGITQESRFFWCVSGLAGMETPSFPGEVFPQTPRARSARHSYFFTAKVFVALVCTFFLFFCFFVFLCFWPARSLNGKRTHSRVTCDFTHKPAFICDMKKKRVDTN
jgi:hypothetical protein